jgi:hypothetical protein
MARRIVSRDATVDDVGDVVVGPSPGSVACAHRTGFDRAMKARMQAKTIDFR